jgi:hypothetical protein
VGARLHVSGGSLGGGKMVDKKDSILILDSTAGVWASPLRENADDLSRRCRCALSPCLITYAYCACILFSLMLHVFTLKFCPSTQ